MSRNVSHVCRVASHSLWRIGKLRKCLDQSSTEKLIHAFVTSRLDYCNSLYFGLYNYQVQKLQHMQNAAARLVIWKRFVDSRSDMTPILFDLHWLPFKVRVEFK